MFKIKLLSISFVSQPEIANETRPSTVKQRAVPVTIVALVFMTLTLCDK